MDKYVVAPPSGSTNNSVGAADRPWKEGHFDSVKLNGGDLGEYLAESTGYGIVSGCEPSISGLTVTVGAGVVHLADGTRKEIASTTVTLDSADSTNPRIDLVYIDSTGTVAKVTGTAAASPSAPSLPTGGISICNVTIAAGATTGTITDKRQVKGWTKNIAQTRTTAINSKLYNGVCLCVWYAGVTYKPYYREDLLSYLNYYGFDSVALTVGYYGESLTSNNPFNRKSITNKELDDYLGYLSANNIKVIFVPQFEIDNSDAWRANWLPSNIEEWFANYNANMLELLTICDLHNVDSVVIASEMRGIIRNYSQSYWRTAIEKFREVYKGKLTYGANCNTPSGDEVSDVNFYDLLDYINIHFYIGTDVLDSQNTYSVEEIKRRLVYDQLEKCGGVYQAILPAIKYNKPIVIGEMCAITDNSGALKNNAINYLIAVRETLFKYDFVKGGYYWGIWSNSAGQIEGNQFAKNIDIQKVLTKNTNGVLPLIEECRNVPGGESLGFVPLVKYTPCSSQEHDHLTAYIDCVSEIASTWNMKATIEFDYASNGSTYIRKSNNCGVDVRYYIDSNGKYVFGAMQKSAVNEQYRLIIKECSNRDRFELLHNANPIPSTNISGLTDIEYIAHENITTPGINVVNISSNLKLLLYRGSAQLTANGSTYVPIDLPIWVGGMVAGAGALLYTEKLVSLSVNAYNDKMEVRLINGTGATDTVEFTAMAIVATGYYA